MGFPVLTDGGPLIFPSDEGVLPDIAAATIAAAERVMAEVVRTTTAAAVRAHVINTLASTLGGVCVCVCVCVREKVG